MAKNLGKILVVEDDLPLLEMYLERLKDEGFETAGARNGQEAIDKAMAEKPDLILLDLMMPIKGGIGVLEVVKTWPKTKDIPVVVITAYGKEEYKDRCYEMGVSDFLLKSETTPRQLVKRLREILKV